MLPPVMTPVFGAKVPQPEVLGVLPLSSLHLLFEMVQVSSVSQETVSP
jgi:hypothetical protein